MLTDDNALTRSIWSDADFEVMSWHDCAIYAYWIDNANVELVMDMDYICAWNQPVVPYDPLSFYIAPATFVVHGVTDVGLSLQSAANPFKLNAMHREDQRSIPNSDFSTWRWVLEGHHGNLSLRAVGYTLYLRRQPILVQAQSLSNEQRGGISFAREPAL